MRKLPEARLRRLEKANKKIPIFKNADCVLVGDLQEMIAEIREYRKFLKDNGFWVPLFKDTVKR